MSYDRAAIAAEIRSLEELLGLTSSSHIAALLRNPGEDYPSSGLVRTYLRCLADPTERFVRLLRARREEVEAQLEEGVQAVAIADRVTGIVRVVPKQHVITLLSAEELDQAEYTAAANGALAVTVLASLAVPTDWVRRCRLCGRPFVARSSRSGLCYRRDEQGRYHCRREWARLERARKRLERQAAENREIGQNRPFPGRDV